MLFTITKGLDLPISGKPEQRIDNAAVVKSVAILGNDYVGMKPSMQVQVGDSVKLGQILFSDKKNPGVNFTSPGAGTVKSINRGSKRVLQSVVIELNTSDEEQSDDHQISFAQYDQSELASLPRDDVQKNLLASGLWTALRTRPYSKSPILDSVPDSIFVTAMDSNPLAADAQLVIKEQSDAFNDGLTILSRLTDGKIFVCQAQGSSITINENAQIELHEFSGPHPSGLVGTHMHFLKPIGPNTINWHLNYQDVIAIGKLFTSGQLWVERIIALAGPMVKQPRLVRTRLGANIQELIKDETEPKQSRVISGPILSGHQASNWAAYLGRFHQQVSVIEENDEREFFGWIKPGSKKYSFMNVFLSRIIGVRQFSLNTSQNGSPRAMVPLGTFEAVMPLDILPTQMLRALLVKDTDAAQLLGCLEFDEEDLALCSFVCTGKYDYGPVLRENLTQIEKEG